jgi:hypothetical protein
MPGKVEERERRRRERPEAEREGAAKDRPRRILGAVSAGVLLAATVAAVIIAASAGDGADSTSAEGAFGTHYEGLEERRVEAGVPMMRDAPAPGAAHIHPELAVYVRGEEVPIPVNIGIDPRQPPEMMAGLHTHDSSGVIHVENAAEPTMGQFFQIWGVPFSRRQLGPDEATGSEEVRMWVDGDPSREFGELVLEDGQEIVVAYGSERELPPGLER